MRFQLTRLREARLDGVPYAVNAGGFQLTRLREARLVKHGRCLGRTVSTNAPA